MYRQVVHLSVLQWNSEIETVVFRTLLFRMFPTTGDQIEVSTANTILKVWRPTYLIAAPNFDTGLQQKIYE